MCFVWFKVNSGSNESKKILCEAAWFRLKELSEMSSWRSVLAPLLLFPDVTEIWLVSLLFFLTGGVLSPIFLSSHLNLPFNTMLHSKLGER